MILILLFNVVIFIWIAVVLIRHARCSSTRRIDAHNSKSNNIQLMISISGIMFLFGITWLFAILTISVTGLRETFQILFTLFNSFQGFFIFLFFCAISKEARESWRELFGSGRQSELLHIPNDNFHGTPAHRNQSQSRTDSSALKLNEQEISKTEEDIKESWNSFLYGWRSEPALEDDKILRENGGLNPEIVSVSDKEDKTNDDSLSLTSATTESGIDQIDTMSIAESDSLPKRASSKQSSSLASSVTELETDHTSCTSAKPSRKSSKDSVSLKVHIRRYSKSQSEVDIEMEVEEMAVELHSKSSSESSDEDSDLNNN